MVAVTLAAATGGALAGAAHAKGCGNGGVVIVAGTQAPRNAQGLPTGGVTGIGARYKARGYDVQYVDYPTQLAPLGTIPYDDDVALGEAATRRAVESYQRRCPGRPVTIAGYSQGARIAGDVLSDAANGRSRIDPHGLSGELYSDPRRDDPAEDAYNRATPESRIYSGDRMVDLAVFPDTAVDLSRHPAAQR